MPISRQARMTRTAISPRLAIRMRLNMKPQARRSDADADEMKCGRKNQRNTTVRVGQTSFARLPILRIPGRDHANQKRVVVRYVDFARSLEHGSDRYRDRAARG